MGSALDSYRLSMAQQKTIKCTLHPARLAVRLAGRSPTETASAGRLLHERPEHAEAEQAARDGFALDRAGAVVGEPREDVFPRH